MFCVDVLGLRPTGQYPFDDEDDELILKLLDPAEKWCPAMRLGEAVQLELESALLDSSQGIVAATMHKLDCLFLLPSERRAQLVSQLYREDRRVIDAMEYFLDAGAAALILTPCRRMT